eukprot:PhM_4_TR2048/c0_g2_i1/m.95529/K14802/DRS2, ATP8A; phospholipid-transporting ATPase
MSEYGTNGSNNNNKGSRKVAPAPKPEDVFVDVSINDAAANRARCFPSNFICTSKYTILTFLPLNLFEQFRRVSNFYFLINMIIALIPGVSPINPMTSVLPLLFVLGVAAIKDGYEDYLRHRADTSANSIPAQVVRNGELVMVKSRDVHAGDIMYITQGDEIRADVLILSSSLPEGTAYMDTCNLDGETNIKSRRAKEETWKFDSVESVSTLKGVVHCDAPNAKLNSWNAVLKMTTSDIALDENQLLFRSAILRNTDWIYGFVVYAGTHTKMQQNMKQKPPKMSYLDHKLNRLITTLLIAQQIILVISCSFALAWNEDEAKHKMWFLADHPTSEADNNAEYFVMRYLTYFILMSYLIPISLFVTIELCKVVQAQFMQWDLKMSDVVDHKLCFCKANTSNLNEQLSQVRYIFSDKTGTLTENLMNYAEGQILDYHHNELLRPGDLKGKIATNPNIDKYVRALALCHTVQPFPDKHNAGGFVYEGQSPDEAALVLTAARSGYELCGRTTRTLTLRSSDRHDVTFEYEILATLEFTPDRKMMSIVLRDFSTHEIFVLTKGADSSVIPRLSATEHNDRVIPSIVKGLSEMASTGLRTLVIGWKSISQSEFDEWHQKFLTANTAMTDRHERVDEVCLMLEKHLTVIGTTAIEDKLQDQVPETLKFLLSAGIVVWMLTGDKRETAVTIAGTSRLCDPHKDTVCHIDVEAAAAGASKEKIEETVLSQLNAALKEARNPSKHVTIVIDGVTLHVVTDHFSAIFLELSQLVRSAVCCRLTPLQKANIVRMFQTSTGATALAVGDGANDVSMIQEGKVGIGIVGMEGAQAALAADYAIPRFKHLRRLLAVHGRYSLYRNAICVGFSFYKNVCLALVQFYFVFYNGGSGVSFFDGWILTFFNVAFTSLPPLFIGFFEMDISDEDAEKNGKLYAATRYGQYFDTKALSLWLIQSVTHSILLFFAALPSLRDNDLTEKPCDYALMGTMVVIALIFLVLAKISLHIKTWNWFLAGCVIVSVVGFMLLLVIYSYVEMLFGDASFYYTIPNLFGLARVYLYIGLFVGGVLPLGEVTAMYIKQQYFPSLRDVVVLATKRREKRENVDDDVDDNMGGMKEIKRSKDDDDDGRVVAAAEATTASLVVETTSE